LGYLEEAEALKEMEDWVKAFHVKNEMSNNLVGILGHYYNVMLDVYSDVTKQTAVSGYHFQHLEMLPG
jgi:L-arabinose isomerase